MQSASEGMSSSGKLPNNQSLRKLMVYAKTQRKTNPNSFELPRATQIVKDARNTLKQYEDVPSQTKKDKDRVRYLRSLRGKIMNAEQSLESEIAHANQASMTVVSDYQSFATCVMEYEEAQDELVELKETGIRTYLELVAAERVEDSKRLREYQLRKQLVDEHIEANFIWLSRYRKLVKIIYKRPHDKWRVRLQDEIGRMEKFALGDDGLGFPFTPELNHDTGKSLPGTEVPLFLRNYVRDINSYDEKAAEVHLQELYDKLLDYEAAMDRNFHTMRVSMDVSKRNLDRMSLKKKHAIVGKGSHTQASSLSASGMAHLVVDERREAAHRKLNKAKQGLPPSREVVSHVEEDVEYAISRMMHEASEIPSMRGKEGKLSGAYHNILVYCAGYGHWEGALRVYAKLSERRIPATFPATYSTMLQSFKYAKPRPKSELVLPLLEEAEECGFQLTREFYHSAMDVFRAAGHWRRAISIFNRMAASGIVPTTHTYSLLEKSGAAARNADPEEVYNALTFAGVPSYLSYTSATACALRRKPKDEGPTADWLGKAV